MQYKQHYVLPSTTANQNITTLSVSIFNTEELLHTTR